jgi:tRNA G26 N,N-dimethylase Trm1
LESTGQKFEKIDFSEIDKILGRRAKSFSKNVAKEIERKKIVASGDMKDTITFFIKDEGDGSRSLNIEMVDYAKFVDKGVKGWDNGNNAPNSPYQFTSKGMPKEGIKRIRDMISSGKMKVSASDVSKYGAVGLERKNVKYNKKSLIDTQTKQAVWMIKKYGIKTRNFIQKPVDDSFKGMEVEISDILGIQIVAKILS